MQVELAGAGQERRDTTEHKLRFDGFDEEISLSCSVPTQSFGGGEPERAGFDPSTFKLAWLDPGKLLWASWSTFAQGQGRYSQDGHLVLLFDGTHFRELFRDIIYAFGRAGFADSSASRLDASFDRATNTLRLTRTDANRWSREKKAPADEPGLFEREEPSDNGPMYLGEASERRVWKYRVAGERLEFLRGDRYVRLTAEEPVERVAKAFKLSVDELRRLNRAVGPRDRLTGVVRIDDRTGPYAPEREDRISGPACP